MPDYPFDMALVLYNTLAKGDELFAPREPGKVTMYTCGPTVYGRPHIGNYSAFLMADLLRRWLEVSGYEVTYAKNITDVGHLAADQDDGEDKVEMQAKTEQINPLQIAKKYTEQYLEDERSLGLLEPAFRPRATENIQQMIDIIQVLVDKGNAYETDDGVYFSVETFPDYGQLSGNTIDNVEAGARVEVKESKRHPADFALWKKTVGPHAHHILRWPSPWGEGFPGWHIECSAMARRFLGETIDIHTGGEDNIFPHHECEIAQSESSGKKPFVRFWLHKRRIDMGSEKMSKSLGNVLTLPDIVAKGYDPLDLRYFLLSVHYRTRQKFAWKGLDDARKARKKIVDWMAEIDTWNTDGEGEGIGVGSMNAWREDFTKAMDSDLNTPAALAVVFEVMAWSRNQEKWHPDALHALHALRDMIARTFGCFASREHQAIPAAVQSLLAERERARAEKNFTESDRLRSLIEEAGYTVHDTASGQRPERR